MKLLLQLLLVTAIWPSSIFASERNVRVLDPYNSPQRVLKKGKKGKGSPNPTPIPTAAPTVPPPTKRPKKSKKTPNPTPPPTTPPTVAPPIPTVVEFSVCSASCTSDADALRTSESFISSLQQAAVAGTDINPDDVEVAVTVEESPCSVQCGDPDRRRLQQGVTGFLVKILTEITVPDTTDTFQNLIDFGIEMIFTASGIPVLGAAAELIVLSPTPAPSTTGRRKRTLINGNGYDDNFNGYDDQFETDDFS